MSRRSHEGRFAQSPASRLADELPATLAADDIAGENSDERNYEGPFGAYGYEAARDFRTEEERQADFDRGPACMFAC